MIVHGVDTDNLPAQFEGCVVGRTLILDGDGPCYVAAATAKRLDTAIRNFQQAVLTQMFLTRAQDCRVHLTASTSKKAGRFDVLASKPYQGNRKGKAKPSLLEPLRQAVASRDTWLPEYTAHLHYDVEADDAMIMDAYSLRENGLIWSDDKDLRMTPFSYWEKERGVVLEPTQHGWVSLKCTPGGQVKLTGHGLMFFWGQMLAGDGADNIVGLNRLYGKLCGPSGAFEVLKDCSTQQEAANLVIDAYRAHGQNPIPEGYLLWLLRSPADHVLHYFNEVGLSDENMRYLHECNTREWFRK